MRSTIAHRFVLLAAWTAALVASPGRLPAAPFALFEGEDEAKKESPDRGKGDGKRKKGEEGKKAAEARLANLLKEHPEADKNKDGTLSPEEAREWTRDHPVLTPERLAKLLKENPDADKNKDGKLTREEAWEHLKNHPPMPETRAIERLLKQNPDIDTDKDGKLSRSEWEEYVKNRRKELPRKAERKKAKRGKDGGDAGKEPQEGRKPEEGQQEL